MTTKLWLALAAAAFLLGAAVLFGPEAATDLFEAWTSTVGGVE